jgi:hypothetical protein
MSKTKQTKLTRSLIVQRRPYRNTLYRGTVAYMASLVASERASGNIARARDLLDTLRKITKSLPALP